MQARESRRAMFDKPVRSASLLRPGLEASLPFFELFYADTATGICRITAAVCSRNVER